MTSIEVAPRSLVGQWMRSTAISPARQIALIVAGSIVVALSSQISIHLPFTPVPITGQTLAVLLVGGSLGAFMGGLSLLLYLIEGAVGLPVLAAGGHGLPIGPTGGYLVGFVLMAAAIGWLNDKGWGRHFGRSLASMVVAEFVLYAIAVPWLGFYVGMNHAVALGFVPFITGDALKLFLAGMALPAAWRFARS